MTDCDKARETINPLELQMRNFDSSLASPLNHYFVSIAGPTLRSTFSTQSVVSHIDVTTISRLRATKPDINGSAYSITSSARARINGGIVRPSALAVLRLMMSLNVVGCSIGRSAG